MPRVSLDGLLHGNEHDILRGDLDCLKDAAAVNPDVMLLDRSNFAMLLITSLRFGLGWPLPEEVTTLTLGSDEATSVALCLLPTARPRSLMGEGVALDTVLPASGGADTQNSCVLWYGSAERCPKGRWMTCCGVTVPKWLRCTCIRYSCMLAHVRDL